MIRELPRVRLPQGPNVDGADENHPMRRVTRQVAFDPDAWTPERAAKVAALFDDLAAEWDTRDRPGRFDALVDAVERGGPLPPPCVEVGAGTGLATRFLSPRFERVIAVDLVDAMLRQLDPALAARVVGDGAGLPVRSRSVGTLVLVNALLFPREVNRVLRGDGALVWVNTGGAGTPIYLAATDVNAAVVEEWDGVASDAGWGTWVVLRPPAH